MSMTQVAFLRKAHIPTKTQIEETIQGLGYDFKSWATLKISQNLTDYLVQ